MINYRWYLSLLISSLFVASVLGFYIFYPNEFGMVTFYGMLSGVIYILAGYVFNFIGEPKKETQPAPVCCEKDKTE